MNVPIRTLERLMLFAGGLSLAGAAWAVSDSPQQLGKRQAIAYYASIRAWLTHDDLTCPYKQAQVSGTITGGSAPAGGSQTITLQFDKGGVVTILKTWSRLSGAKPTSSVEVACSYTQCFPVVAATTVIAARPPCCKRAAWRFRSMRWRHTPPTVQGAWGACCVSIHPDPSFDISSSSRTSC